MKKEMSEKLEILVEKYAKVKQSHQELRTIIPLTNVTQHQLIDQNIHLLEGIMADLLGAVGNLDTIDSKLPIFANFRIILNETDNICNACNKLIRMRDGMLQPLCECNNEMEGL